jgi:hypothetical protein
MSYNIISLTVKGLFIVLIICCFLEIIFFPQIENIIGIFVTFFSFQLFKLFVFKREIICQSPFSFLAMLGLFLFMYLPILATLCDGHPISFGMIQPIKTFCLQFIYFCITILAFHFSNRFSKKHRGISKLLNRVGYFTPPTHKQIWILGFLGILPKIYLMLNQFGEEMTTGGGFANMLSFFAYAPVTLLFHELYGGKKYNHPKQVYFYIAFLAVLGIATNSRNQVLYVLATWLLISMIHFIIYKPIISVKSLRKTFGTIIFIALFIPVLADLAFAMVTVRGERYGITAQELFKKTWELYTDKEQLNKLKNLADRDTRIMALQNMRTNWNEYYVNNIFLQRLCNYRVVDATIYHAENAGIPNSTMQEDLITKLKITYPTPIVQLLFGNIKKENYQYSPMDLLLAKSQNTANRESFLVGGDVGLGFSYFGYWYFIIQYIIYFVTFYLMNQLSYIQKDKISLSVLTMISSYKLFLTFQVGPGIQAKLQYLIYGYFISIIIYLFIYKIVRYIK